MRIARAVACSLAAALATASLGVARAQTDPPPEETESSPASGESGAPPEAPTEENPGSADAPVPEDAPGEGAPGEGAPAESEGPETEEPAEAPDSAYDYGPTEDPFAAPLESDGPVLTLSPEERARLLEEMDRYRGPFAQGRLRISVLLGGGTNFNDDYLVLGAGVGYFLLDGLEASVGGTAWLLGDPFIATVTPGLTYVFYQVPKVHPYLGAFYRHYFIGGEFDDLDSYGGRSGIYWMLGEHGYLGGGVVYERLFDCRSGDVWSDCDQWYPEFTFAFVF